MRILMALDPIVAGGYPIDSDLSQMTDDGCPHTPPRLTNQVEQYNLSSVPFWSAKTRWQRLGEEIELRLRWRAFCERMVK